MASLQQDQGKVHSQLRPGEAHHHQRAGPGGDLNQRGGQREVRLRAPRPAGVQLPHRGGQPQVQRAKQDGGLPEDLLRLVQPVREVQTRHSDLGEEEGKVWQGKYLL